MFPHPPWNQESGVELAPSVSTDGFGIRFAPALEEELEDELLEELEDELLEELDEELLEELDEELLVELELEVLELEDDTVPTVIFC